MTIEEIVTVLLIVVPSVSAGLCLIPMRSRVRSALVIGTALALMVLGLSLFVLMSSGAGTITIDSSSIAPAATIIEIADLVLMFAFLFIAYRERSVLLAVLALANLLPLVWFEGFVFTGSGTEPAILVDNLSLVLTLIACLVGGVITIYALKYMDKDPRQGRFFAVTFLFLAGMNGAVFSNDMLWLLMFWEVTTFCSYLLIGHDRTAEAKQAAKVAITYTLGGGAVLLAGVILVNHYYGTIVLSALPAVVSGLAILPIGLLAIAAFTKSAQPPFQKWLLGAMVAPTPVSALLHSSTMVNLGVYLLLRLSPQISSSASLLWPVALVGAVSFMATAVLAIAQSNAKRVLAYSTIGNLGLIAMCAAIGTSTALFAGVILLLFHAVSKALLFLTVGVVKHETGSEDIEGMASLRASRPFVTLALLVGVFAVLLPPFGMFASKWMISEVALDFLPLAFLLAVGFGASVVYYVKWLGRAYACGPGVSRPSMLRDRIPGFFKWTLMSLMLGAIVLSVLIGQVGQYLVEPFVGILPVDLGFLTSAYGAFPLLAVFVVLGAVTYASYRIGRAPEEKVARAYTCGEPFEYEVSGDYYMGDRTQRSASLLLTTVAVVLIAVLLMLPFAQGGI